MSNPNKKPAGLTRPMTKGRHTKTQYVYLFGQIAEEVSHEDEKWGHDKALLSLMKDFWIRKISDETFCPDLDLYEPIGWGASARWILIEAAHKILAIEAQGTRNLTSIDLEEIRKLEIGTRTPRLIRQDPLTLLETFIAFCKPAGITMASPATGVAALPLNEYKSEGDVPDLFINTYIKSLRLSAGGLKIWRKGKGIKKPGTLTPVGEVDFYQPPQEITTVNDIPNLRHRAWVAYAKKNWKPDHTEVSMAMEIWERDKKALVAGQKDSLVTDDRIRGILNHYKYLR